MSQPAIFSFTGVNFFLSNFSVNPDGSTNEHLYQAAKTHDPLWIYRIMRANTPGEAKKLGQKCPLRPNWDTHKTNSMLFFARWKFFTFPRLHDGLLLTGDAHLEEGNNWHDNFWGNCHCGRRVTCEPKGQNWLGKILIQVRTEINLGIEDEENG